MHSVQPNEVPAGAQLIDVREPDEFAGGHARGAVNIPLSTVPENLSSIDRDRDLYVICHSGGRSAQACRWLVQNGIDAINVSGGTSRWIAAGLPTD